MEDHKNRRSSSLSLLQKRRKYIHFLFYYLKNNYYKDPLLRIILSSIIGHTIDRNAKYFSRTILFPKRISQFKSFVLWTFDRLTRLCIWNCRRLLISSNVFRLDPTIDRIQFDRSIVDSFASIRFISNCVCLFIAFWFRSFQYRFNLTSPPPFSYKSFRSNSVLMTF